MAKCPHCGGVNRAAVVARVVAKVVGVASGLSITSTLAACYGAPCAGGGAKCAAEIPTCDQVSSQPKIDDKDGDGIDQNCDGGVDATK
jgi:hypothetical protein